MNSQQLSPKRQSFIIVFEDGNVEMIRVRKDQCLHFAKFLTNMSSQLIEMSTISDEESQLENSDKQDNSVDE